MTERVIIVGGDSKLGSTFETFLQNGGVDVASTTRRHSHLSGDNKFFLDLASKTPLTIPTWGNIIYLVAAITKVVDCDADPQVAWRINADAPVALALQARAAGLFPVFISSDAVERAPNLVYSRAKAYAEVVVLAVGGAVIRPSRIPIGQHRKLLDLMWQVGTSKATGVHRWEPPS